MREYKFRAWYKPAKKMILPEKLESINFDTKVLGVYIKMEDRGFHRLRMSDFELMQYHGLKDKNGVEIYEGDIAKRKTKWGESIYIVVWVEDAAKVGLKIIKSSSVLVLGHTFPLQQYFDKETGMCTVEVVGNIHEHKHLLEEVEG